MNNQVNEQVNANVVIEELNKMLSTANYELAMTRALVTQMKQQILGMTNKKENEKDEI